MRRPEHEVDSAPRAARANWPGRWAYLCTDVLGCCFVQDEGQSDAAELERILLSWRDDDEETTPAIAAAETASPVRRGGSHAADDKVQPKPPLPSPVGYKRGKDLPAVVF